MIAIYKSFISYLGISPVCRSRIPRKCICQSRNLGMRHIVKIQEGLRLPPVNINPKKSAKCHNKFLWVPTKDQIKVCTFDGTSMHINFSFVLIEAMT